MEINYLLIINIKRFDKVVVFAADELITKIEKIGGEPQHRMSERIYIISANNYSKVRALCEETIKEFKNCFDIAFYRYTDEICLKEDN